MGDYQGRMVVDAVVNIRGPKGLPVLQFDGEDFPYLIDKMHGVKVESQDDNVHLVIVAIQVDRSVTVTDHATSREQHG